MTFIRAEVETSGKIFNGAQTQAEVRQAVNASLLKSGLIYQGEVGPRTPFGFSGKLRRGWVTQLDEAKHEVTVANQEEYALVVEEGRKPGKGIPIKDLQPWVRRVIGISEPKKNRSVAFLVSRKAKLFGIKGQHFAADTFRDTLPKMNAEMDEVGANIVQRLEK